MKNTLLNVLLKTAVPPLLGAAGALAATMAPAYYAAICGATSIPVLGG